MCFCLTRGPACPFHWVGGKVKRENISTRLIPHGNSHPSSCHQAVTSCHFQPYVALGTWLHQGLSGQMYFQNHCKVPCLCLSLWFLEESICGDRGHVGVSLVADSSLSSLSELATPCVCYPTLLLNSAFRSCKWMSDVSQIQQSSHQLVHAAGLTLPGWEFLWYMHSWLWKRLSFVTSAPLRRNPSLVSQRPFCCLLASNCPGVTCSCTSRRCKHRVCLEVNWETGKCTFRFWSTLYCRKGCKVEADF